MVMRNRNDEAETPDWWDDLPPAVRKRFAANGRHRVAGDRSLVHADPTSLASDRPGILGDLSRLAVLFAVVAVANLLFLLIALSFLSDRGTLGN